MKIFTYLLILVSLFTVSCGSTIPHLFSNQTPHEKHAERLRNTGLSNTPQGQAWLAASQNALMDAQVISLPFKLQGYFHSDKPRALGLTFQADEGEEIVFHFDKKTEADIYTDLYRQEGITGSHLLAADDSDSVFRFVVKETGIYVLRLQPELDGAGHYSLAISSGPSIEFPVSGSKARVGSFWGDSRDGGKRSHEGIDIFAPKRTPVIAAADGYISSVGNGGLGGKTVHLRPVGAGYSLYYAHLDEQLVEEGQYVRKGEVLGLVGNTGNARTTPPHLHFGIYSRGGAVNPLPFVERKKKNIPSVTEKDLSGSLRVIKTYKTKEVSLGANSVVVPLAVTSKGYIAETAEGRLVAVPFSSVKPVPNANVPVITRGKGLTIDD